MSVGRHLESDGFPCEWPQAVPQGTSNVENENRSKGRTTKPKNFRPAPYLRLACKHAGWAPLSQRGRSVQLLYSVLVVRRAGHKRHFTRSFVVAAYDGRSTINRVVAQLGNEENLVELMLCTGLGRGTASEAGSTIQLSTSLPLSTRCREKPSRPASCIAAIVTAAPECFSAFALRRARNSSSARQSPPGTRCFDILSAPDTSDVTSHFDGLSSNET